MKGIRSGRAVLCLLGTVLATMCCTLALPSVSSAADSTIVTHSATKTIPGAPASNYSGTAGGDGWDLSFSNTQVFNVFHHSSVTTLACHLQSNASQCWPARTVTDASNNNFATSDHSGTYFDAASKKLYVYATRTSDNTAGVVCIDTALAATSTNPFCGFTALSPVGDAYIAGGKGHVGNPVIVGSRWYAFNFVEGAAVTGGKNTLLCFDLSTKAACASQPFSVSIGAGNVTASIQYAPAPSAAIGSRVYIPTRTGANDLIACFDTATNASCAAPWPIAAPAGYVGFYGPPFAKLNASGAITGLCLPMPAAPCFTTAGASVATPAGLATAINQSVVYNGEARTLGTRVYVPEGSYTTGASKTGCYDYATSAGCANFPHATAADTYLQYTLNRDPQRPSCFWTNSDSGTKQIQNFDAFSGGACGEGARRVLTTEFLPTQCAPTSYTALQLLSPTRNKYASGTVSFRDENGNVIPGAGDRALGPSGSVSLAGLNLGNRPQFLISLNGGPPSTTPFTLKLTWQSKRDSACGAIVATPAQPSGGVAGTTAKSTCGRRPISLIRADRRGRKVVLRGLVVKSLAGKRVSLYGNYGRGKHTGHSRKLGSVKTNSKGQFKKTVRGPARRIAKHARYRAKVGKSKSAVLKLYQQLATTSVRQKGDTITVRGKVQRSLLGRRNKVTIQRLVCGHYKTLGSARPNRRGRFVVKFKAPLFASVALYRAKTRMLERPHGSKYVRRYARALGITLSDRTG